MSRWVLCVDMDAFFASVEQLANPDLRGKPVVVAGPAEERGVVSSASYEARRYGIRSAMPTARAKLLCPEAVFLRGRPHLYEEYSRRVLAVLAGFSPLVEQASIDEAYLDVTGCEGSYGGVAELARAVKKAVRERTGLGCSIGAGPNRLLAKMASEMDKPDGLVVLTFSEVPARLWPKPVEELHGVGPKTAARLGSLGISTIGELAAYPPGLLVREFGCAGRYLHLASKGLDDTPVRPADSAAEAKSVSHETTFARDVDSLSDLERTLLGLADRVARKLRREGLRGRTVVVKVRKADFTTVSRSRTLAVATDLAEDVYREARAALGALWRPSLRVRLVGVGVENLERRAPGPGGLFDRSDRLRKVSEAVDRIRDRYGERAVTRASLLTRKGGKAGEKAEEGPEV